MQDKQHFVDLTDLTALRRLQARGTAFRIFAGAYGSRIRRRSLASRVAISSRRAIPRTTVPDGRSGLDAIVASPTARASLPSTRDLGARRPG
jgi:hypothetical protein